MKASMALTEGKLLRLSGCVASGVMSAFLCGTELANLAACVQHQRGLPPMIVNER